MGYFKQDAFSMAGVKGLTDFYFAPLSLLKTTGSTIATPSASTVAGDTAKIITAHVFGTTGDGFYKAKANQRKHDLKFKANGEVGSVTHPTEVTVTFYFQSEAEMLEMMKMAANDEFICLSKLAKKTGYMQVGDAEEGALITFSGDTGTLENGSKYAVATVKYSDLPYMYTSTIALHT